MAKESMKAREVKREKTVAKYAEKRKALLEAMIRINNQVMLLDPVNDMGIKDEEFLKLIQVMFIFI